MTPTVLWLGEPMRKVDSADGLHVRWYGGDGPVGVLVEQKFGYGYRAIATLYDPHRLPLVSFCAEADTGQAASDKLRDDLREWARGVREFLSKLEEPCQQNKS